MLVYMSRILTLTTILGLKCLIFTKVEFVKCNFDKTKHNDIKSNTNVARKSALHKKAVENVSRQNIEDNLRYLSEHVHYAGSTANFELAKKISDTWKAYGFDKVQMKKYNILLSYAAEPPVVSITDGSGNSIYTAAKMEKVLEKSENKSNVLPPFIAYTSSGNPRDRKLVYANYGRPKDFDYLKEQGIDCNGAIAIIRYGRAIRGHKLFNAQRAGAVGVILYSDPIDWAGGTVDDVNEGNKTFPYSEIIPSTAVQRGTAYPPNGDPLTPGLPSTDGIFRRKNAKSDMVQIPVFLMSYKDALEFLKILDEVEAPDDWQGGLKQVGKYKITMGSQNKRVSMDIKMKLERRDIYDVIGTITGSDEPDRLVLAGNHRDSWVFGAIDPSSGTAALMELSRSLKDMRKEGWRPRRSIVLCSWDAEEYGLMGSIEWVEEYSSLLSGRAVAYLNVDMAVSGNFAFNGRVSPLLAELIMKSSKKFDLGDKKGQTIFDRWLTATPSKTRPKEPNLLSFDSGGSDFKPFALWIGVTCADIRYSHDAKASPTHYSLYHSLHDTFYLVKNHVDPKFIYHQAVTRVLLDMVLNIADSVLLPFSVVRYAEDIKRISGDIKANLKHKLAKHNISTDPLDEASAKFYKAAVSFQSSLASVNANDALAVRIVNDQMMQLERAFIASQGISGRPFTRHVIFSPSKYAVHESNFPGIKDTIYEVEVLGKGNWDDVHKQISIVVNALRQASKLLKSSSL